MSHTICGYLPDRLSSWTGGGCTYAVIACDSVQTACHIYMDWDRMECEPIIVSLYIVFALEGLVDQDVEPESVLCDKFQDPSSVVYDMPDKEMHRPPQLGGLASQQSEVNLTGNESSATQRCCFTTTGSNPDWE